MPSDAWLPTRLAYTAPDSYYVAVQQLTVSLSPKEHDHVRVRGPTHL